MTKEERVKIYGVRDVESPPEVWIAHQNNRLIFSSSEYNVDLEESFSTDKYLGKYDTFFSNKPVLVPVSSVINTDLLGATIPLSIRVKKSFLLRKTEKNPLLDVTLNSGNKIVLAKVVNFLKAYTKEEYDYHRERSQLRGSEIFLLKDCSSTQAFELADKFQQIKTNYQFKEEGLLEDLRTIQPVACMDWDTCTKNTLEERLETIKRNIDILRASGPSAINHFFPNSA